MQRLLRLGWILAFAVAGCSTTDEAPTDDGGMSADGGVDLGRDSGTRDSGPVDMGTTDMGRDAGPACTEGCGVVEVNAGFWHTCARRENGQVLCWGDNFFNELGHGNGRHMTCPPIQEGITTDCSVTPVQPVGMDDATDIEVRRSTNSCARHEDGSWQCWGMSFIPNPGMPTEDVMPVTYPTLGDAEEIANTGHFACVRRASGAVECVGYNTSGQLGDGTNLQRMTPVATGIANATQIDVGSGHACALLDDGAIKCWGNNLSGQLGDNMLHTTCGAGGDAHDCSLTPVDVLVVDDAIQIATGDSHTCALRADHSVWCWGGNSYGAIGSGDEADAREPVQVAGLTGIVQIAAGDNATCALDDTGVIHCWGGNRRSTLGDGVSSHSICSVDSTDCSRTPVTVATIDDATSVTVGGAHACAIRADESVWCWGYNVDYQTGQSPNEDVLTPVRVSL